MWRHWILLCAAFFPESFADKTVVFGKQLSIGISAVAKKLEFISADKSQNYTLWSSSQGLIKGNVVQWSGGKRFIINTTSFDNEGNYIEQRVNGSFVTKVKVLSLTRTEHCEVGQTLNISLDGLRKDDASLLFSSGPMNLTLVHQGSLMWNTPNFEDRIRVSNSRIQVLSVRASDVGKYTLLDRKSRKVKTTTLNVSDPCTGKFDVKYGHQLRIKLLTQVASMGLTPLGKSQTFTIWSSSVKPNRGTIEGSGNDKHLVVTSVTFDDQGNYTQRNISNIEICVTKVKVIPSTETKNCEVGQTLNISLSGLKKNEANLHFSKDEMNLKLVTQGSPVGNLKEYSKRIKVTSNSIQLSNVQVADIGYYKLLDGKGRVAKITSLKVIDPCAKEVNVTFGKQLRIKLLVTINSLGFISMDSSQNNTVWPQSVQSSRGTVVGKKRYFTMNSTTFDDQGNYTQWDKENDMICATKVTVLTSLYIKKCAAGETLTIILDGIKENEASLHFSNKHVNLTLVRKGSLERNLRDYNERIIVTNSSIQVVKVNMSDVGQYTLFDGKGRKARIITLEVTGPISWLAVGIVSVIVIVIGLLCGVYHCWKKVQADSNNTVI